MNVGSLCKVIPVCFPHELLGFNRYSLKGLLLSLEIVNELVEKENAGMSSSNARQSSRFAKHRRNK